MGRANRYSRAYFNDGGISEGKKEIKKIYKYVNFSVLKDIIKSWSLRITSPLDLNDPLECLSRGETQQNASLINIKFLCLTEVGDSHVMWAHYADKHTGACLEFNLNVKYFEYAYQNKSKCFEGLKIIDLWDNSDNHKIEKSLLHKVIYEKNRPTNPQLNKKRIITEVTKNLITKSPEWEYEQEYRSFFFSPKTERRDGIYTTDHLMPYLKRIILGVRANVDQENEIKRMLSQYNRNGITLKKASIDPMEYKVLI